MRKIEGYIIKAEKYYSGVIFAVRKKDSSKTRKVYVEKELLNSLLLNEIENIASNSKDSNSADLEITFHFLGKKIKAKGVVRSGPGGEHSSFIDAEEVEFINENYVPLWDNLDQHEKEREADRILSELGIPQTFTPAKVKNFKKKLISHPNSCLYTPLARENFLIVLAAYRLATGSKKIPTAAIPICLEWLLTENYKKERKISMNYSEAIDLLASYFLIIPKTQLTIKNAKQALYVVETSENDFTFTTFKIYKTLESTLKYLYKTLDLKKDEEDLRNDIKFILTKGQFDLEANYNQTLKMKAFPVRLIESLLNEKKILIVTGKAGTGKTTLIKDLAKRLKEEKNKEVCICALSGRSSDQAGGSTISYLEKHGIPKLTEYIFVDEAFTLDLFKFNSIIKLLNNNGSTIKLLLVGDPEQNPPPQGFEIIRNVVYPLLCKHGCVIEGVQTYRFKSEIKKASVLVIPVSSLTKETISSYLKKILPVLEEKKLSWFVTSTLHWKDVGTVELNKIVKEVLGKENPEDFEVGDRVIFRRNLTVNGIVVERTGYEGIVEEISEDGKTLIVKGLKSGESLSVKRSEIVLGYVFESYNAQGREADCIISFIPCIKKIEELKRKLKVALTRARLKTFMFVPKKLYEDSLKKLLLSIEEIELKEIKNSYDFKEEIRKITEITKDTKITKL